jgi:hypothetical protein
MRDMNELTSLTNETGERSSRSSFKRAKLASPYRVLSSESDVHHLLIERISTVTSEFLQYRARIRMNQAKPNGYRKNCRTD